MSELYSICNLCNRNQASLAFLDLNVLNYTCNSCLVSQVKSFRTTHLVLSLSRASSIEPILSSYLPKPFSTLAHTLSAKITSKTHTKRTHSNYTSNTTKFSNPAFTIMRGKSLESDLSASLSTPDSQFKQNPSRFIIFSSGDISHDKLHIYDVIRKKIINTHLDCRYSDDIEVLTLSLNTILVILTRRQYDDRTYFTNVYYLNIYSKRSILLLKVPFTKSDRVIYCNDSLHLLSPHRIQKINLYNKSSFTVEKELYRIEPRLTFNIGDIILFLSANSKIYNWLSIKDLNILTPYLYKAQLDKRLQGKLQLAFAHMDSIFILTNKYIYICGTNMQVVSKFSRGDLINIQKISSFCVLDKSLYYYSTDINSLGVLNLWWEPSKKRGSNKEHQTRYLYIRVRPDEWYRIDCKYNILSPLKLKYEKFDQICEVPPKSLITCYSHNRKTYFVLYSNQYPPVLKHINYNTKHACGRIYCKGYVILFCEKSLYRFNIQLKMVDHLRISPREHRSLPDYICAGSKIYIIGGGALEVNMYDVDNHKYYYDVGRTLYKYAVGRAVGEWIYVIYNNGYQIYDHDFKLVETKNTKDIGYKVYKHSLNGFYNDKIYFYNDCIKALEYFDIRTGKRGVESLEYKP